MSQTLCLSARSKAVATLLGSREPSATVSLALDSGLIVAGALSAEVPLPDDLGFVTLKGADNQPWKVHLSAVAAVGL